MKSVQPDYFGRFACIKGSCRHSCCVGWEVDIDEDSLERFRGMDGEIGKRLRSEIHEGSEGAYFAMRPDGRCPFLNDEGLCELILEAGEGILCQICDDHPRFRSFFSDREEIGLGLCCEAAGALILANPERVRLMEEGEEAPDEEERELLLLRQELTEIMQDRLYSVEKRVERMLEAAELELDGDLRAWAGFLQGLEQLEGTWQRRLAALRDADAVPMLPETADAEISFEQLMVYLLYRHLPMALEDDDPAGHILYCALVWRIVRAMVALAGFSMENMVEICREYSAEIEYSDENIGAILDELNK